jgi:hypothetical protein
MDYGLRAGAQGPKHGMVRKAMLTMEVVGAVERSSVNGENRREGDETLLRQVPQLHTKEWGVRDSGKGSTIEER